ncbi:hypothetical protein PCANC_04524 [Puccinia coronata f. sp. avenae]|uniref:Uncharacterized protein n=1 Tax=Puccinia coronata f. sp. avenae TaxID=200324 RepID=A0A2N5VW33_9BASI|nr:hypothetical protein PCANC_04524 [Puccinia coronata f. sp. avenae]
MTLLRLLYLPISLCYFLWAIPSPADSLLPSPGHVNSQGNPGLRADLDLYEWLHMVTRGGDESTGHNNPHQFDSDQMDFLDNPIDGPPLPDESNEQSGTSEEISDLSTHRLTELQDGMKANSASKEGPASPHQLNVDDPTQPGKSEAKGRTYRPVKLEIKIQSEYYKSDGHREAGRAEEKYEGTHDTLFSLHQRARGSLKNQNPKYLEASQDFEKRASEKLQQMATLRRYLRPTASTVDKVIERLSSNPRGRILRDSLIGNRDGFAFKFALQYRTSDPKTRTFVIRINFVGFHLNALHTLFSLYGVDQHILGYTDKAHQELLDWLHYLIFTHPHTPDSLSGQTSTEIIPFHDKDHSTNIAHIILAQFLMDRTPRISRCQAAPTSLALLEIWYQIKCSELGKPILSPKDYRQVLRERTVLHSAIP